jgi:hypothetical protein
MTKPVSEMRLGFSEPLKATFPGLASPKLSIMFAVIPPV